MSFTGVSPTMSGDLFASVLAAFIGLGTAIVGYLTVKRERAARQFAGTTKHTVDGIATVVSAYQVRVDELEEIVSNLQEALVVAHATNERHQERILDLEARIAECERRTTERLTRKVMDVSLSPHQLLIKNKKVDHEPTP